MKFSSVSAATAAFFTSASAVSTFAVVNRCKFDIYLWHVEGGSAPSQMFTLPGGQPQIGYSETYKYVSEYAGVSIKAAPYYVGDGQIPPPSINITQLEYTVPPPGSPSDIWYDLSMVNGNAFMGVPFTYSPSSPNPSANCVAASCSGDYELCSAGYNFPTDDSHTHACPYEQDIIFTFCDGNSESPLLVPTGQVTQSQFSKLTCINGGSCDPGATKREVEPEPVPQPEADAGSVTVCSPVEEAAGNGVGVYAVVCPNEPSPAAPAPVPTTSSSSTVASAPSAVAALQQPAKAPTTTSSSSSSTAAAPTQAASSPAAPAPAPAPAPAGPPTSPLSQLQLSSLSNTGVTCWLSVDSSNNCGVSSRGLPEKRSVHEHSHRHNHMAFHRRNRIIKSA